MDSTCGFPFITDIRTQMITNKLRLRCVMCANAQFSNNSPVL